MTVAAGILYVRSIGAAKIRIMKPVNSGVRDYYKPVDFEEGGAIFCDIKDLDKTDAGLFPDELEEYTPEERREKFKLHSNNKKKGDEK